MLQNITRLFYVGLLSCLLGLLYIYMYPVFRDNCDFPRPDYSNNYRVQVNEALYRYSNDSVSLTDTLVERAPFRLLTLADPQIEGDTALPKLTRHTYWEWRKFVFTLKNSNYRNLPLLIHTLNLLLKAATRDCLSYANYMRKTIDLIGNDYYLGHIYRTMAHWTDPTHVVVLGDLLGSQWIDDAEFSRRSQRYWNRIFRSARRADLIDLATMSPTASTGNYYMLNASSIWKHRIIHIAGNHDIGYAGDLNEHKVRRFEERFGLVNGVLSFALYPRVVHESESPPMLRVAVLNSQNLDGPALSSDLQDQTIQFLEQFSKTLAPMGSENYQKEAVILLTHIPLYKPDGLCADSSMFKYFPEELGGGIREQNLLSAFTSRNRVLRKLFNMRSDMPYNTLISGDVINSEHEMKGAVRPGIILSGHDHTGCDVYHYLEKVSDSKAPSKSSAQIYDWQVVNYGNENIAAGVISRGVREITVRSMMGMYGGNAGMLSGWINSRGEWQFGYASCEFGTPLVWWVVHISSLTVMLVGIVMIVRTFSKRLMMRLKDIQVTKRPCLHAKDILSKH